MAIQAQARPSAARIPGFPFWNGLWDDDGRMWIPIPCWLIAGLLSVSAIAAEPGREGGTNAPIRDLGQGRFQIGAVTLDTRQKALTFPAVVNMTTGLVEYAVVTTGGKVHESLLRTDAEPFHIHTAMLLLGAKVSTNMDTAAFFDSKKQIPGSKMRIEVLFEPDTGVAGETGKPILIETFLAQAKVKNAWNQAKSRIGFTTARIFPTEHFSRSARDRLFP